MKMLIQIVLVALVVGGVSAAGSFYWHQQLAKSASTSTGTQSPKDAQPADAQGEASDKSPGDSSSNSNGSSDSDTMISTQSELNAEPEPPSFGPPVAVRPPFDPNGDEAGDLIDALRIRAASASRQERRVVEREEAMKLIVEDLRVEQASSVKMKKRILDETNQSFRAVDDVRLATEAERVAIYEDQTEVRRNADEQIQSLRREKEEAAQLAENALKAIREEQEDLRKQLDAIRNPPEPKDRSGSPDETVNLKKMVGVVDSLPPEDTAKILQELVEKGKTEAVVAVLNAMKPRQSAKVLSAITESKPVLAADLIDRLKRLKKEGDPPKEAAK